MYKLLLRMSFLAVLLFAETGFSQVPQQFNYQGALRDADGNPVANKTVSIRLSILDGSASGAVVYQEVRSLTTNKLGLYTISIGGSGASAVSGSISLVDWASNSKYLKVEVDLNNGANYEVAGTSQLLSVPYALYAANSPNGGSNLGNASGDLSGAYPGPKVVKIQGVDVSSVAPQPNQVLQFDGTYWKAVDLPADDIVGQNVETTSNDVLAVTNGTGAALKKVVIDIKPGEQQSILSTDDAGVVKWQKATDARLVSGTLFNIVLDKTVENESVISSNTSGLVKVNVAGAVAGNPVFVTVVEDVLDFSVAAAWVSAAGEVSIRFANYQPKPVSISGKTYKILLIQ